MNLTIEEGPLTQAFEAYAKLSIAFTPTSRLRVELMDGGLGGISLVEEPLPQQEDHDSDLIEGERPAEWPNRWDVSGWRLLRAFIDGRPAGGTAVGRRTVGSGSARERPDLAALWDIRVDPAFRRAGVGSALLRAAADWARRQGCTYLRIETQNTNVAACRFYAAQGASLGALDCFAYEKLPDQVGLDWFLAL